MMTSGDGEQRLQLIRALENCWYLAKKYLLRIGRARQQLAAWWQRRREAKLYRQWVAQADLPPEVVPTEVEKANATDTAPRPRPGKVIISPNVRYFLLVVAFLIICAVLIAILARFC